MSNLEPLENVTNVNMVVMALLDLNPHIKVALVVLDLSLHMVVANLNLRQTLLEYHLPSINLDPRALHLDPVELAIATQKTHARLDLLDQKENPDMTVWLEFPAFPVKTGLMLKMLLLKLNNMLVASTAQLDLKDHPDLLEELVLVVCVELVDNPVFPDVMEILDSQERSDLKDPKDLLEKKANQERMELMLNTQLDYQDLKENPDHLDHKEMKDYKEKLDQLELKDQSVTKDLMERTVKMEKMVKQVSLARKENLVLMPNIVHVQLVVATVVFMVELVTMVVPRVEMAKVIVVFN